MRPTKRMHVNKRQSVGKFKRQLSHTKALNVRPPLTRGGTRL